MFLCLSVMGPPLELLRCPCLPFAPAACITGSRDWLPDALLPPDAPGFIEDLGLEGLLALPWPPCWNSWDCCTLRGASAAPTPRLRRILRLLGNSLKEG